MTRIKERLVDQVQPKFGRELVLESLRQTLRVATTTTTDAMKTTKPTTTMSHEDDTVTATGARRFDETPQENGEKEKRKNADNDNDNKNDEKIRNVEITDADVQYNNDDDSGNRERSWTQKLRQQQLMSSFRGSQQQQERRQRQVVLVSGFSGLCIKQLCDMVYGSASQSCWYTWTTFMPPPRRSSSCQACRRRISAGGDKNRNILFPEIVNSISQIVAQINSLKVTNYNAYNNNQYYKDGDKTQINRELVVKHLRSYLTVMDTLELIEFCGDFRKLEIYSDREIHIAKSTRRLNFVSGFLPTPRNRRKKNRMNSSTKDGRDFDPAEQLFDLVYLFLKAVSDIKPIIWAFDDLQFGMSSSSSDCFPAVNNSNNNKLHSSLAFIDRILNQSDHINLVFVGIIRQDKIKERDPYDSFRFQQWIDSLGEFLQLQVKNMTKDDIVSLFRALLRSDDVEDLAELFFRRTNGNDYFVLQLLNYLEDHNLITFSTWTYQWQWDIDEIKRQSMVADNVLVSIGKRFMRLSRPVQCCLHLAAHLGYRFDEDLLDKVMRSKFVREMTEMKGLVGGKTHELLKVALNGNFIERIDTDDGGTRYKFVHVQVQSTCQHMSGQKAPKKSLQRLHWNIGSALWRGWKNNDTYEHVPNRVIFPCVKEINLGHGAFVLTQDTTKRVIRLNYESAKRSYAIQAYFPAASYLESAIRLLKDSDWTDDYDLTLELHTALVQMYLASGKLHYIPRIVRRVKLKAKEFDDRLPVEIIDLYWCKMVGRLDANVSQSVALLNRLGVKLRLRYFHFQSEGMKRQIQETLHSIPDELIKRKCSTISRETRDGTILLIERQLVRTLMYAAGFTERPERRYRNLVSVVCCKMIEAVLNERSQPDMSVVALCIAASMFSNESKATENFARVCRFLTCSQEKSDLDLSIRLLDLALSLPIDEENPQIIAGIGLIKHWRAPLTQCTEMNLKGYEIGMKSGNLLIAFQCAFQYISAYFMAGLPLDFLLKDVESILLVMIEYGQKYFARKLFPYYQVLLNLTDQSEDLLDVDRGKAIDRMNSLGLRLVRDADDEMDSARLTLYLHCQEYRQATKVFEELKDLDIGLMRFQAKWHVRVYEFAIVCIHNASDIRSLFKRRYWKKLAKFYVQMIKIWVEEYKAINLGHKLSILQAAMLSFERPSPTDDSLMCAFDEVIARSARSGFFQDAAFSAVLASTAVKDDFHKKQYAFRAMELYSLWDARCIVKHLQKKYRHFRQAAAESDVDIMVNLQNSGPGVKGRERFNDDAGIMKVHRSLNAAEDKVRKQYLLDRPSDVTEDLTPLSAIPQSKSFSDFPGLPSCRTRKSEDNGTATPTSIEFHKRR